MPRLTAILIGGRPIRGQELPHPHPQARVAG
jgi:hypothetical protein